MTRAMTEIAGVDTGGIAKLPPETIEQFEILKTHQQVLDRQSVWYTPYDLRKSGSRINPWQEGQRWMSENVYGTDIIRFALGRDGNLVMAVQARGPEKGLLVLRHALEALIESKKKFERLGLSLETDIPIYFDLQAGTLFLGPINGTRGSVEIIETFERYLRSPPLRSPLGRLSSAEIDWVEDAWDFNLEPGSSRVSAALAIYWPRIRGRFGNLWEHLPSYENSAQEISAKEAGERVRQPR
jgi:hypothetical protein